MSKKGLLTERQARFVEALAHTPNVAEAVRLAGYSGYGAIMPSIDNNPHIKEAIRQRISRSLTRAAPQALAVLLRIARDPKAPYPARVTAARDILDRGGFLRDGTMTRVEDVDKQASLADLTAKELQDMIVKLERERGQRRAVVIEAETEPQDDVFG